MHRFENPRLRHERESPSFSSSLLDKIYRSIDEGENGTDDLSFFRETMAKKQQGNSIRGAKKEEDESVSSFRRACLIEKWIEKKAEENQRRRDQKRNHSNDTNDALFFSSTSSSSDSSSGGFSSSDTESIFSAGKSASTWPKPIRTCLTVKKQRNDVVDDETLIKSKSRALKIYNNLKKVKQPISPGGKLASFINGIFKPHGKTSKTPSFQEQSTTTCSSASSFSRSCLSKSSPSTRERLRSTSSVKRSVRFVDADYRPRGHKSLDEEEEEAKALVMPVSLSAAWKTRRVGETAREFLRDYRQNQIKNELIIMRDQFRGKDGEVHKHVDVDVVRDNDDEEDDDTMSCSSSDLFELDHLAERYQEELPVYETTRVDRNRAISNGLKV